MSRRYLGVELYKPRVAFFDFSSCEGCQLQVINNEGTLLDFLSLVDVVKFREAMTGGTDDYEIAFIEGSITRADEIVRLKKIRERASVLVALGSCACFGGVNQLRNSSSRKDVISAVYKDYPIDTLERATPVEEHVKVDLKVYGCPIKKEELETIVLNLAIGKAVVLPAYPVCLECKAKENVCLFEKEQACLGPVTRAGCNAWCPSSAMGCRGCRGPAEDANIDQMVRTFRDKGFPPEKVIEMLECFGGFEEHISKLKASTA